jgi:hypothetical protein
MITEATHLMMEQLEAGLGAIRATPTDAGAVRLIARRPREGEREVLDEAQLDLVHGLVGDSWKTRGSSRTPDGSAHPEMQITIKRPRYRGAAPDWDHWPLPGINFCRPDLSVENAPRAPGSHFGSAVLEVTLHLTRVARNSRPGSVPKR